jgi:uncharacterized protein YggT (Ycf19 family)
MDLLKLYHLAALILRELVLINFYALVGQGVLFVLAGRHRETNLFYRIIKTIASPAVWVARRITPRFVMDQHVPWVALFLLVVLGVALTVAEQVLRGQLAAQGAQ